MFVKVTDWLYRTFAGRSRERANLLSPEDQYVVNVTARSVTCSRPDGVVEQIDWEDLTTVEIEANDGPWGRLVWFVLRDSKRVCHVPHGSLGGMSLMAQLQSLPEWDNGAILAALRSEGVYRFECWSKDMGWRRSRWGRPQPQQRPF